MLYDLSIRIGQVSSRLYHATEQAFRDWLRPCTVLALATAGDLARSKPQLLAENALLRQQLIAARRQIGKAELTPGERVRMVILASITRRWRESLLLVKPDTLLRWHRQGFRLLWRRKTRTTRRGHRIAEQAIALIQQFARENFLWGAERIRGELLKLGIRVCKRTIQKYAYAVRGPRPHGQSWATFLRNHAHEIWACDFLQTYDLWFRCVFVFFIIEIGSRRVVHVGVTRSPTQAWVAQQMRNVTPGGTAPRFLIRDNDGKFGKEFDNVAKGTGIKVLRTPYHAPKANAFCERFLGSVRRECLDHTLILSTGHLERVLSEYVEYFNNARPHQGVAQRVPSGIRAATKTRTRVERSPVLGGLHNEYRWAA